jgi:hypothetical protein
LNGLIGDGVDIRFRGDASFVGFLFQLNSEFQP